MSCDIHHFVRISNIRLASSYSAMTHEHTNTTTVHPRQNHVEWCHFIHSAQLLTVSNNACLVTGCSTTQHACKHARAMKFSSIQGFECLQVLLNLHSDTLATNRCRRFSDGCKKNGVVDGQAGSLGCLGTLAVATLKTRRWTPEA